MPACIYCNADHPNLPSCHRQRSADLGVEDEGCGCTDGATQECGLSTGACERAALEPRDLEQVYMGCVLPEPGFLEGLRELCDRHGAALLLDTVSSFGAEDIPFDAPALAATSDNRTSTSLCRCFLAAASDVSSARLIVNVSDEVEPSELVACTITVCDVALS